MSGMASRCGDAKGSAAGKGQRYSSKYVLDLTHASGLMVDVEGEARVAGLLRGEGGAVPLTLKAKSSAETVQPVLHAGAPAMVDASGA